MKCACHLLLLGGTLGCDAASERGAPDGAVLSDAATSDASSIEAGAVSPSESTEQSLEAQRMRYVSGARLKRRLLRSGEHVVGFAGWYDSVLETMCSFRQTEDGALRCVPTSTVASWVAYADAACSLPMVRFDEACSGAEFGTVRVTSAGCTRDGQLFRLARMRPAGAALYVRENGHCVQDGTHASTLAFVEAEEIPLAELVSAELRHEVAPGQRLGTIQLLAQDGARQHAGFWDNEQSTECVFRATEDGDRCIPKHTLSLLVSGACFVDAERVLSTPACVDDEPALGATVERRGCVDVYTLLERGARAVPQKWAEGTSSAAACRPATATPAHHVGRPLAPSGFVRSDLRVGGGRPGRLKPRFRDTPDGRVWLEDWLDTELNVPCRFTVARGKAVCLPHDDVPSAFVGYEDAACTVQTPYTSETLASCSDTERPSFDLTAPASCPQDLTVDEYDPIATAGPVYWLSFEFGATRCAPIARGGELVRKRTASLPPTSFVGAEQSED